MVKTKSTVVANATQNGSTAQSGRRNQADDPRLRALFESLRAPGADAVRAGALREALSGAGLRADDPRLHRVMAALDAHAESDEFDAAAFERTIRHDILLVERALQGNLVLPEFDAFVTKLRELFERTSDNRAGAVADYIPQLSRVDPERYAASVCSVDGQRAGMGAFETTFSMQSCVKPINYCLALEEHGEHVVHQHIGCEPSGNSFNELSLNSRGRPHNPMINSGAIMSCSLIRPDLSAADRFDHVQAMWTRLSGGLKPGFDNATYLSERRTADRNFALGYFMRENGAFPQHTDLLDTLELYFQSCSMETTTEAMSVMAATLANGGICPLSGERVLAAETVQKCLSLMYSCGMYDFSGEWAFRVGLPAKSGVSGCVWVVVPGVLGLCVWSPRLDERGNSVRGIDFCGELVRAFDFHRCDDVLGGASAKHDPRRRGERARQADLVELYWAASRGDAGAIRRLLARGADLGAADYDGRTALHLAASEGHPDVIDLLLAQGVSSAPRDRWGHSPLDDAEREGHAAAADRLRSHMRAAGAR